MSIHAFLLQAIPATSGMWLDYAKTLLLLTGVCLLAVFIVKVVLPKLMGVATRTASNHIEVFARQPLEPRKFLYLVRVGKSVMLLASSGDQVNFMSMLDAADFVENKSPVSTTGFLTYRRIMQVVAKRNNGGVV